MRTTLLKFIIALSLVVIIVGLYRKNLLLRDQLSILNEALNSNGSEVVTTQK